MRSREEIATVAAAELARIDLERARREAALAMREEAARLAEAYDDFIAERIRSLPLPGDD